jgi:hypothetical protein
MFARKPSRTVTGAAAAALAVPEGLEELGALEELELLEEQPAMRSAPPVTATAPAKMPRIYSSILYQLSRVRENYIPGP